jgi:hypothetical protein
MEGIGHEIIANSKQRSTAFGTLDKPRGVLAYVVNPLQTLDLALQSMP